MERAARQALGPLATELLSLVADGVISTDETGTIILVNQAVEQIFRYEATELLGKKVEILLPDRFRAIHEGHLTQFSRSPLKTSRGMARGRTVFGLKKSGEEFPMEASLTRHTLKGCGVLTVVLRDISERQQIEEGQRLVTAEISHRLKNLMAVVNSIISLTARGAGSVKSYQQTLQDRLAAVARTVDLLLRDRWTGADLRELLKLELAPFENDLGSNILLTGHEVKVPARSAVSLTLALHELATNAAKYGALSSAAGQVRVAWDAAEGTAKPVLTLSWLETGGPAVQQSERRGFGSDLIARSLGKPNTRIIYHPDGLEAHLQVALRP